MRLPSSFSKLEVIPADVLVLLHLEDFHLIQKYVAWPDPAHYDNPRDTVQTYLGCSDAIFRRRQGRLLHITAYLHNAMNSDKFVFA